MCALQILLAIVLSIVGNLLIALKTAEGESLTSGIGA